MATHLINEQVIDLQLSSSADAPQVQQEVRDFYFEKLLPRIEKIFDELSVPGELLVIDSLELDIGELGAMQLTDELERYIRERITSQVNEQRRKLARQQLPATAGARMLAVTGTDPHSMQLNNEQVSTLTLVHFLESGQLPWWNDKEDAPVALDVLFENLLHHSPALLVAELVRLRGQANAFRRLAFRGGELLLPQLAAVTGIRIDPDETRQWAQLIHALSGTGGALTENEFLAWISAAVVELHAAGITNVLPQQFIAALVRTRSVFEPGGAVSPIQQLYTKITAQEAATEIVPLPLLQVIAAWEKQETEITSATPAVTRIGEQPVLRFFFGEKGFTPARIAAFLRWKNKLPVLDASPAQPALTPALLAEWTGWTVAVCREWLQSLSTHSAASKTPAQDVRKPGAAKQQVLETLFGSWPPSPVYRAAIAEGNKKQETGGEETETAGSSSKKAAAKKTAQKNQLQGKGTAETDTASPSQQAGAAETEVNDSQPATAELPAELLRPQAAVNNYASLPEKGIKTNYGGLVLLGPFLPAFFKILELTDGKQFISREASHRAVFVLHYLATKTCEADEPELGLHKLLCGLSFEEPVPMRIELTDTEKEHAEELLTEVATRWERLRTRSGEALRQSFLGRKGRITDHEFGHLLRIEQAAVDILISTLPWGVSVIKAPWMKQLLQVEW